MVVGAAGTLLSGWLSHPRPCPASLTVTNRLTIHFQAPHLSHGSAPGLAMPQPDPLGLGTAVNQFLNHLWLSRISVLPLAGALAHFFFIPACGSIHPRISLARIPVAARRADGERALMQRSLGELPRGRRVPFTQVTWLAEDCLLADQFTAASRRRAATPHDYHSSHTFHALPLL